MFARLRRSRLYRVARVVLLGGVAVVVLATVSVLAARGLESWRVSGLEPAERVAEDLSRLETILLEQHPDPALNVGPGELERAVDAARAVAEAPGVAPDSRVVHAAFARLVAALRDPHTVVAGRYQRFGILPVQWTFVDGQLRLLAAEGAGPGQLGARVTALDGRPIEAVLAAVRPFVPAPNESGFRSLAPGYLRTPGLLEAAGVLAGGERVRLTLETDSGEGSELALPRRAPGEIETDRWPRLADLPRGDARPRHRRPSPEPYWLEELAGEGAVYVRYARAAEASTEPMDAFARRVLSTLDSMDGRRVVVDVRGNGGGDPTLHIPLVSALRRSPRLAERGSIVVLIDGGVLSAGVAAVADLQRRTPAVLVGEPTGDRPAPTSDARPFTLPHTGVEVRVATVLMGGEEADDGRRAIEPDVAVSPGWEEWRRGTDPVLRAGLEWEIEAPETGEAPPLPGGRYAFDPLRALELTPAGDGTLEASVTGLGRDLLRPRDGRWTGGIHRGLRRTTEDRIERLLPSGEWRPLPALAGRAPLELVLEGREEEAGRAFAALHDRRPGLRDLTGMGMVREAAYLYESGRTEAGRILFDIAGRLHDDWALLPLQHALLRQEATGSWIAALRTALGAVPACMRRYSRTPVENDLLLCL